VKPSGILAYLLSLTLWTASSSSTSSLAVIALAVFPF